VGLTRRACQAVVCAKCVSSGSRSPVTAESPDSVLRSIFVTLLDGLVGLFDGGALGRRGLCGDRPIRESGRPLTCWNRLFERDHATSFRSPATMAGTGSR
jgi:hypothetical protein